MHHRHGTQRELRYTTQHNKPEERMQTGFCVDPWLGIASTRNFGQRSGAFPQPKASLSLFCKRGA